MTVTFLYHILLHMLAHRALSPMKQLKSISNSAITGFEHFEDVFDAVPKGRAEIGIVPYENSLAGKVNEVVETLKDHKLKLWTE